MLTLAINQLPVKVDWRAQECAKVVKDPLEKSHFGDFDAPKIYFLENLAYGKVNDYHYRQGAHQQRIGKVVIEVLDFVELVVVYPYIIIRDVYPI